MIKEPERGREGDKPLVESRYPNEEQHPGVSVGLIWVQVELEVPNPTSAPTSEVPRAAASSPQRDRDLSTQTPQGFASAAFGFPLGCSAQLQRAPKAVGSAQSQALLTPFQLPHAPLKGQHGPGQAKKGHPGCGSRGGATQTS